MENSRKCGGCKWVRAVGLCRWRAKEGAWGGGKGGGGVVEMHGEPLDARAGSATLLPPLSSIVFAYGATGAGKTHTMLGREGDPGIMYLTTMELYRRLEACQEEKQFEVLISYQEVGLSPPWAWVASSLILTTHHKREWSSGERVVGRE